MFGKYLSKIGVTRSFSGGIVTTGSMAIAFGLLNHIQDGQTFIGFSFAVRIVEAVGNAAFLTSSFSMVADLFPKTVATVFSLLEMFLGVGIILGPAVGSILYEAGGYTLPFAIFGSLLMALV